VTEITVFADIVCPFAHVGLHRWAAHRDRLGRHDVRLLVRAWPLEIVNGTPMDPDAMQHKVDALRRQVAPELFAGFDAARFPATSLPALALTHAAYRVGAATGEAVALHMRRLLFDEGADISERSVLAEVGRAFGLPEVTDADAEAVLADHRDGVRLGVVGSPHFFLPDGQNAFCPTLDISRRDGELDIHFDTARFDVVAAEMFA